MPAPCQPHHHHPHLPSLHGSLLLLLALGDHGVDVLDLLVRGEVAELGILSDDGLDVDVGHADLSRGRARPLDHHARLLCPHHAHHGLLLLLLRHEGLLLGAGMTHQGRLRLHRTRVLAHDILDRANSVMLQGAGILGLLRDILNRMLLLL